MSWWNAKYPNNHGEYEITFASKDYEKAKAVEKVCCAVLDKDVKSPYDVEVVVRCRECKHHRDKNEQEQQYLVEDILICTSQDATDDCWNAVWPDHFCSYGKRKEGADNG